MRNSQVGKTKTALLIYQSATQLLHFILQIRVYIEPTLSPEKSYQIYMNHAKSILSRHRNFDDINLKPDLARDEPMDSRTNLVFKIGPLFTELWSIL